MGGKAAARPHRYRLAPDGRNALPLRGSRTGQCAPSARTPYILGLTSACCPAYSGCMGAKTTKPDGNSDPYLGKCFLPGNVPPFLWISFLGDWPTELFGAGSLNWNAGPKKAILYSASSDHSTFIYGPSPDVPAETLPPGTIRVYWNSSGYTSALNVYVSGDGNLYRANYQISSACKFEFTPADVRYHSGLWGYQSVLLYSPWDTGAADDVVGIIESVNPNILNGGFIEPLQTISGKTSIRVANKRDASCVHIIKN